MIIEKDKVVFFYPSGDVFVGEYHKSQRNGMGLFTFRDGSYYDGQWFDSAYHGYGELVEKDGACYKGEWKSGSRDGKGTEYDSNGMLIRHGVWQADELIREEKLAEEEPEAVKAPIDYGILEGENNRRWSDGEGVSNDDDESVTLVFHDPQSKVVHTEEQDGEKAVGQQEVEEEEVVGQHEVEEAVGQ